MTETNDEPAKKSILFWIGLFVMVASLAPLLLFVVFGPKDGNPIGLGLLMVFGCPLGLLLLFLGLIVGRRK